ncbi:MAG: cysteine desulfurase family protein [Bacteroidota bacterium]
MNRIYLDNAATTPLSEEVIAVMSDSMRQFYGNPSSIHACGRRVRAKLEESRKKVAHYLGASIGEIFFTSGGTESNNMAIKCAVRDLGVTRIISSRTEHHCVGHSLEAVEKQGVTIEYVDVDRLGRLDYDQLESKLKEAPGTKTLVSLMHANNEIGTLSDMQRISELCEEYGAYYHSDTVQTIGHIPIDVSKTKIHFLSGGAHKFHGPKGCGFIYINGDAMIKPMIDGGSQERNMRAGTENIYGIVGMAKALELACENLESYRKQIDELRSYFKAELLNRFEDIHFHGDQENYLYTVLNVCFPKSDKSAMLLLHLDIAGISASGGSACSSGAEAGSHVLNAIGADAERKSIRFSFSHYTTKEDIDFTLEKLAGIVKTKSLELA